MESAHLPADAVHAAAEPPRVVFKKRTQKATARKPYRPPPPPPSSSDSDGPPSHSDSDHGDAPSANRPLKRRRVAETSALKASNVAQQAQSAATDAKTTVFAADRSATIEASNDAVKQSAWFAQNAADGGNKRRSSNKASHDDDAAASAKKKVGPMKAPANIRTVTITDYAPDVCKDYKLTGYCGFGDSCKFLHSRDDFAAGWQLDKEWEALAQDKKKGGTVVSSAAWRRDGDRGGKDADDDVASVALLEKIPFVCLICQKSYARPIKTKCGHYFCEPCALKRFKKDQSCAACGAATGGVFNMARNLERLLDRKKKMEEAKTAEKEKADDGEGHAEGR